MIHATMVISANLNVLEVVTALETPAAVIPVLLVLTAIRNVQDTVNARTQSVHVRIPGKEITVKYPDVQTIALAMVYVMAFY